MTQKKSTFGNLSSDVLYSLIGDQISVAIFCVDEQRVVVHSNAAFRRLFAFPYAPECTKITLTSLFTSSRILSIFSETPIKGKKYPDELVQCATIEGITFWASISVCTIEIEGRAFFCGTMVDKTSEINNQKLLREKSEDLQKINQQLDRFLYSASHDVRQPLTSMLGLIRLMRMENLGETDADYLGKLEISVKKLDHFLSQIKDFSKNSHERITSEQIQFDVLLESICQKFESQLARRNIKVCIHLSGDNVFYSDASRVALAIYHVVKNAIDYSDACKSESFIRLVATCYENHAVIEVIDNGIGIAKTHVGKVTEMFYRATERSNGSGIGLYLVNEIILKLGGRLSIDSELSLGTIVRMDINNGTKGLLINRKKMMSITPEIPGTR